MKAKLITLFVTAMFIPIAQAQIVPIKAADFLAIDHAQQMIYYGRWLDANRKLINECMPGWSDDQILSYYDNWLQDNPQYFERSLQQTFSASMFMFCKKKPKPPQLN